MARTTTVGSLRRRLQRLVRLSFESRRAAGKPAQGTVRLSARQEGGEILIAIEDNGGGLDIGAIRRKATDRGLIEEGAELSERELQQMIFEPGFSTADQISSVSGRGVGMDAVRSTIDSLGGSIDYASYARPTCQCGDDEPGRRETESYKLQVIS